jgi:hypothetical protein
MKALMLLIIFFAISCGPNESTTRIVSNQPVKPGLNPPVFGPKQNMYWYTTENVGYNLVLLEKSTDLAFIRGLLINNYLNAINPDTLIPNWQRTYCLVVSFIHEGSKEQLRARATPIAIGNLKDNTLERIFKIDWPNAASNIQVCSGDLPTYKPLGKPVSTTTNAAFTPIDLCPTCKDKIGSTNISLYFVDFKPDNKPIPLTTTNQVPLAQLEPAVLKTLVDFTKYPSEASKCTTSFCVDQGKDCCLNNQCIKNATEKTGAILSPDYEQAKRDVELNPSRYTNYPQIFNICTLPPPVPTSPTTTETQIPILGAEQRFQTQKAEYYCLEEAKKDLPNYQVICNNKWLCVPEWILTDPTFSGSCETLDGKTGLQRKNEIKLKVWKLCGCKADPFPTSAEDDDPRCPDFTWKANFGSEGVITDIICSTTEVDPYLDTLQYPYTLPARSAPHRFYRGDNGKSVDDITTIQKEVPEVKPEGREFLYLDDVNKTDPDDDAFNMNAITGQFNVNLSQAQPAKMIAVEFDADYVIAVVSGSLNPCPLCTKDTWEPSFYVWAKSEFGRGLEAIGYTTARNQINSNLTLGNYEDTGFGRYCYLPPTMLPWSMKPAIDVKDQRQRRLLTQSAFYANGYQRDWFGFNQGAIIGSFDGVSWFAVGNIRKITSTSTKLFLAINKPYADLTDNSAFEITVGRDVGNSVPDTDFDPELTERDSRYNKGSSCQKYHVCENDIDCVTQLGWEYTCADVTKYKSSWPVFRSNADEVPNAQIAQANFTNILKAFGQTGQVKRCVYRGNGAPCKKDYANNMKYPETDKLLACAPNFYCASLTETSLNSRVDREPAPNNVYFYGQVTDRLGRPQFYIGGDTTWPQEAKENFKNTAIIYSKNGNTDDFGICRPGRLLITTSTPGTQPIVVSHAGKDQKGRTDFMSQVASCDSNAVGNNRAITCPYFEETSATATNYGALGIINTSPIVQNSQNMCGAESQYLLNGVKTSTFQIIELNRIATLSTIDQPSIVRDACLRRAGAVCHENLDCGPSELHTQQAFSFGPNFFGGTVAEMEFWRENLICGQGQIQPAVVPTAGTATTQSDPYFLNRNRCCRNITEEFTMYTQYKKSAGAPDLIPDNPVENIGLEVLKYPYINPVADNRYSRYAITQPLEYTSGHAPSPVAQAPILTHAAGKPQTPKEYQWKTFNDTGKKTCCGGGFVRLFSDGTHDWKKTNRVSLSIGGLSCLNYQDSIVFRRPLQVDPQNYNKDYGLLCNSPGLEGVPYVPPGTVTPPPLPGLQTNTNEGVFGCTQVPLLQPSSNAMTLPWDLSLTETRVSTVPDEKPAGIVVQKNTLSSRAPYIPTPFLNTTPISVDVPAPTYFVNQFAAAQSVYLPLYIGGRRNITRVTTSYYTDNTAVVTDLAANEASQATCQAISQNPEKDLAENTWCIQNSAYTGGYDVLHVRGQEKPNGKDWGYGGFTVYFNTINTKTYDYCTDNLTGVTASPVVTQSYCTWTGVGGGGANPLVPSAGINGLSVADGCYGSPVYLPVVGANGARFYYERSSTWDLSVQPNRTDKTSAIIVGSGNRASFESNGSVWQYLGQSRSGSASSAPPCPPGFDNDPMAPTDAGNIETVGMGGGNALYYLTKLARLELVGIPQIFYEPLYCNSNRNELVPGIFNVDPATRNEFQSKAFKYNPVTNAIALYNIYNQSIPNYAVDFANPESYIAMQDLLSTPAVFSSYKFACCKNLGTQAEADRQCCSEFSVKDPQGRSICKLPQGADLYVYFNRFVSGDGVGDFQPGGGLVDTDFIPETGEPNLTKETTEKIRALGIAYCASGQVRYGAAFGYFYAQPNNGYFTQVPNPDDNTYYSIIDSSLDYQGDPGDTLSGTGTLRFLEGYRWNHHLYCAPQ